MKENNIKKFLSSSLIGFPVGITLLMVSYIFIYIILGKETYAIEINQLQDIKILVAQLLINGVSYYLLFLIFHYYVRTDRKYFKEHPYKDVLLIVLIFCVCILYILCMSLLSNGLVFSNNIGDMNAIVWVVFIVLFWIFICIKTTIDNNTIKKVNQKLKEFDK